MMINKFSDLLCEKFKWKVNLDSQSYSKEQIHAFIYNQIVTFQKSSISFDDDKYIICMGLNSFQFFLYILLASVLNLKIIFANPQQLVDFKDKYPHIPIQFIFTFRTIQCSIAPILILNQVNLTDNTRLESASITCKINTNRLQANIVFNSSGTTGLPKLILYREENLIRNAEIVAQYLNVKEKDICLCIFPVNYMYGFSMLFSMLIRNATVILERTTVPPFAMIEYLDNGVTFFPILSSIIENLYPLIKKLNKYYTNLTVLNAADKIYKTHVEKILSFAPIFWNNFGQTESGPRIFAIKIETGQDISQYCHDDVIAMGFLIDKNIEAYIYDEDLKNLPDGEIGELYYKTPYGMEGIINQYGICAKTSQFINSGDLVFKDSRGIFFWAGRKIQTIKVNGYFVNINLIHTYFDTLEGVKSSFTLYDDNKIYGFFEVFKDVDQRKLEVNLIEKYRETFPNYPRLEKIIFLENLPMTETGKINIKKLKIIAREKYFTKINEVQYDK